MKLDLINMSLDKISVLLDDCWNFHGRLVESIVHVALLVSELLDLKFVVQSCRCHRRAGKMAEI